MELSLHLLGMNEARDGLAIWNTCHPVVSSSTSCQFLYLSTKFLWKCSFQHSQWFFYCFFLVQFFHSHGFFFSPLLITNYWTFHFYLQAFHRSSTKVFERTTFYWERNHAPAETRSLHEPATKFYAWWGNWKTKITIAAIVLWSKKSCIFTRFKPWILSLKT